MAASCSIAAYLANEGRKVTIVCPNFDGFLAASKPLPAWVRESRYTVNPIIDVLIVLTMISEDCCPCSRLIFICGPGWSKCFASWNDIHPYCLYGRRFIHTTWLGKKILDLFWSGLISSSVSLSFVLVKCAQHRYSIFPVPSCRYSSGLPSTQHTLPVLARQSNRRGSPSPEWILSTRCLRQDLGRHPSVR